MPLVAPMLVQPAARSPLPFGLFSALTLRPEGAPHWQNGVQWQSLPCTPLGGFGQGCVGEETVGMPKQFEAERGDGEASPFGVYGEFACIPTGFSEGEMQSLATDALLAGEQARVEQALWTGDLGNVPNLTGNNDSVPDPDVVGTGLPADLATGYLEQYAAANYGGALGVIHVTPLLATLLSAKGLIAPTAGRLDTVLGTPVVVGAGYPGTGPQGSSGNGPWMYVTPPLFGYRSDVFTSTNGGGDLLDRERNVMYAIAERSYLIGFDPCGIGAVSVEI